MSRGAVRSLVAAIALLVWASPVRGQATQPDPLDRWIGRPIVAVEIHIEGRPDSTPALLALVDIIHVGDPLTPDAWRRVTQRLNQEPRFEDVSVKVEERADGVVLIFDLVPRHPIEDLAFSGTESVQIADLKRQVQERFNGLPAATQLPEVEDEVRRILGAEGYRSATATATIAKFHNPDRAVLNVAVTSGPRSLIADWKFTGTSPLDPARTVTRLGLVKGAPYRDRVLGARLAEIRDELRSKQFYAAIAQQLPPAISEDGTQAVLAIHIDAGPRVELVVKGDALPGSADDLIPIKRQSSVDTDLLEDAQVRIAQALREQGYWHAQVTFSQDSPAPDRRVISYTIERGKRYRIAGLDLPAGLQVSDASFQAQKALQVGAWFDENSVGLALRFVQIEYQRLGFHRIVMKPTYEERPGRSAQEGGVVIHPNITEGPKATITSITFDLGDHPIVTARELADRMVSKEHQPYAVANLSVDRDTLPAYYESRGFLNRVVVLTPTTNDAATEVKLAVVAREGPQIFVGEIAVVGNDRVKRDVILREIKLRTGEPYSEQARIDSQRALYGLPSLRSSRISVDERLPGETTVRIVISVEESDSTTFEPGGGFEVATHPRAVAGGGVEDRLEFAPRASVGISRRNLGGHDRVVSAFARVSLKPKNAPGDPVQDGRGFGFTEYRIAGTLSERHVFGSATNLQFQLASEQAIRTSYNFIRRVGTADMFRAVSPRLSLLGSYRLEWTRLFDEIIKPADQPLIDRLFPQVRLSIVSSGVVWNNQRTPSSGEQVSANLDVALRQFGSEVGFAKSFAQGSIFRPVFGQRRLTFAGRLQVGLARGFKRTVALLDADGRPVLDPSGDPVVQVIEDLPASQRYFAGGSNTVRGFQLDRLGVAEILNADGLSNGGNGLIVVNLELRAQAGKLFKRQLTVVGFVDSGNVFHRASDMDLGRLRTAVGFGVRYDSPIGPLRMDLGFKTDRMIFANARERRWEFHLSLGEVF